MFWYCTGRHELQQAALESLGSGFCGVREPVPRGFVPAGVVTLLSDYEVCKEGDVLTPEQARVLVSNTETAPARAPVCPVQTNWLLGLTLLEG